MVKSRRAVSVGVRCREWWSRSWPGRVGLLGAVSRLGLYSCWYLGCGGGLVLVGWAGEASGQDRELTDGLISFELDSEVVSSAPRGDIVTWDKITLEEFIELALRHSQRSLQAQSEYKIAHHNMGRAEAVFKPTMATSLEFSNSHADQLPRVDQDAFQSFGVSSSVSRNFAKGSTLKFTLQRRLNEQVMVQSPSEVESVATTSAELALLQSLTKNRFGRSWQLQQEMAVLDLTLGRHVLAGQLDELAKVIVTTFFSLKTQQQLYASLVDRTQKNKDIFATAQILHNRGNVETADLLNIEARYLMAIATEKQALIELQNSWYLALDAVGVPTSSIPQTRVDKFEFMYTPLLESDWSALCVDQTQTAATDLTQHSGYQLRQKRYDLTQKRQSLLRDELKPDLNLKLSYGMAYMNGESSRGLSHPLSGDHGVFKVGLDFKWQLGGAQAQPDLWDSVIRTAQAQLELQTFARQQRIKIQNSCRLVNHLVARRAQLKEVYTKQRERARLQRQRFNIGRQDFFTATAGELEAVQAKFNYETQIFEIEKQLRELLILQGKMVAIQ